MRRRRHNDSPFSLFAFQDIITSVTGILLLIMLLLCVSLITRELSQDPPMDASDETSFESSHVAELEGRVQALRTEFEERKSRFGRLLAMSPSTAIRRREELRSQVAVLTQSVEKLDAETRAAAAVASRPATPREQAVAKEVDAKSKKAAQLRRKLDALKQSGRLVFHPSPSDPRQPWVVQVDNADILVAPAGRREPARRFASPDEAFAWVRRTRRTDSDYFVLFVKPGGIWEHYKLVDALHEADFRTGIELIGANQTVVDPHIGAGEPE